MSKVDWSLAPKWADHVVSGPLSGINYWANDERRIQFGGNFDCKDNNHVNEGLAVIEVKPKPWSGPKDGLPPVGLICEAGIPHTSGPDSEKCIIWIEGSVIAYHEVNGKTYAWFAEGDGFYPPAVLAFRPIKTPDQLAAEQRETYIREFMDIVGIDCRVTASKAVDAGFKLEVV